MKRPQFDSPRRNPGSGGDATAPKGLIYLAYAGAVVLATGILVLGDGLVRPPAQQS